MMEKKSVPVFSARMGLVYSVGSAAAYAMLPVFTRMSLASGMSSLEIMQLRYGFGVAMVFLYLAICSPESLKISPKGLFIAFVLSFGLDQITSLNLARCFETLTASTGILIFYIFPAITTVLSVLIYKTPVSRKTITSMVLVAGGCCLVLVQAFSHKVALSGVLYVLSAAFTFALSFVVLQRVMEKIPPLTITFYVMLFTTVGFNFVKGDITFLFYLDSYQFLMGLLLGLIPTALGVTLLYLAISVTDSGFAALCSSIEPAVTVLAAYLLLSEPILIVQVAGMLIVMLGIFIKYLDSNHPADSAAASLPKCV
ncbi:DMT family transporter [Desulfobotulus sp. H1]|uniref:DMT family transporter n=1 Tax=Desulfobotulus pelophilus TaxID=2823377 RepID=A0ABT3N5Z2_9BACT|nr:DMT family transporter [Desulfobotulus pelophilus]MCW7752875.1 DMT family transporter [Desulfobotulus pelophilus]